MLLTGKSRLRAIYELLDVHSLTPEVKELLEPRNCPFFAKGDRLLTPRVDLDISYPSPNRKKRQPIEHEKALRLYEQGMTDNQISRQLGVREYTVFNWRHRNGLPAQKRHSGPLNYEQVREFFEEGMDDDQIAQELACSAKTIRNWRKREHLPANTEDKPHA